MPRTRGAVIPIPNHLFRGLYAHSLAVHRYSPARAVRAFPHQAEAKKFELDGNHSFFAFTASTVIFDVEGKFTKYKPGQRRSRHRGGWKNPARNRCEVDRHCNKTRDKHLLRRLFASAKFPKLVFTSKKVAIEGDKLVVDGTLDLHGVQKDLKLTFAKSSGVNGAGVKEWAYRLSYRSIAKTLGSARTASQPRSSPDQVTLRILVAGFPE